MNFKLNSNTDHSKQVASIDSTHLANLRISYEHDELLEHQVANTPMAQLMVWFNQALVANIPEPNAMTLSTVGKDKNGIWRPSSRIVLVKQITESGLTWFTNYNSRKGKELAENPYASLQFHWVLLERQIRIEGRVEQINATESDLYFKSRPLGSQIGALSSPQSEIIEKREVLEMASMQLHTYFQNTKQLPDRPNYWGGYCLRPEMVEFWQGRPNRLHDRLRYRLQSNQIDWILERLAP